MILIFFKAIFVRSMDNRVLFWNKGASRPNAWCSLQPLGRDAEEILSLDKLYEPTEARLTDKKVS